MKTKPAAKPAIDKDALLAKYAAERDKRLRADGNDQYLRVAGQLAHYLDDPYTPFVERPAVDRPRDLRLRRRRLRRPGDRRAAGGGRDRRRAHRREGRRLRRHLVLEPLSGRPVRHRLDDLHAAAGGDRPPADREVRPRAGNPRAVPAHRQAVRPLRQRPVPHRGRGPRLGRGEHALGDPHQPRRRFTASFIGLGTGPLHVPKLPGIPGIESFKGHSFHTSRWDYAYTGGDPYGRAAGQAGRQAGGDHRHRRHRRAGRAAPGDRLPALYVVQRTPSSVDVRANAPIDPDWFEGIATPGWQQRWLENFTANQAGGQADEDRVQDGWTDLSRRIRAKISELPRGGSDAAQDAGGLRGQRLREDGGDPRPGRDHRPAIARRPRS